MKKLILFSALAMLAIAGCKKKEDGIEGTWKVTAATFTPPVTISGTTYTDAYYFLFDDVCSQDNLFIFKEGTQVVFDEGATKCDDDDDQQTFATYSLNGSTLLLVEDGDTTTFTNVTIDEENMKGTLNGDFGGGTNTDLQIVWTRQ